MAADEPSGTGGVLLPETWSDEVRAIFQRVVDAMTAVAPAGWRRLELETILIGGHGQQSMDSMQADGSRTSADTPGTASLDALVELRAMLYRPGAGVWYTARCSITDQGSFEVALDYDNAPAWDLVDPPAPVYAADLASFPRDPENIPPWLAERLRRAGDGDGRE